MKVNKTIFLICLFIFPSMLSTVSMMSLSTDNLNMYPMALNMSNGVSKYNITQNVKYQVDINFTLTSNALGLKDFWFKFSRLNDRQPNSSLTPYCPPYQESNLLFSKITGYNTFPYVLRDKFNNTYDLFNSTLNYHESVILSQKYNITLNEIKFQDIDDSDIGLYNMSDEIFDLYCKNETYYEGYDSTLIAASNSIVYDTDNPVEKAEKICNWVSNYLTYDGSLLNEEKGALWAYNNHRGDCSEYSSLMITLLRIQNIPARKVTGFCISANPSTEPYPGKVWTFKAYRTGGNSYSNFLGHAWVEYYVPNIGWIACDPTWHSGGYDYFNRIDFLRFNLNIGQWFSIPMFLDKESEFPHPCIVFYEGSSFDYIYQFKVTVLDSEFTQINQFPVIIIIVVMAAIVIALVAIVLTMTIKKKRKKEVIYYEY